MTCRTCDCADKAADTDEWVTFAKRPVEPLTSWSHHDIPELAAEKVSEVERLTAELAEVKRTYTPCDLDLLTERDALAAQVARVEKLAEWFDSRVQSECYGLTVARNLAQRPTLTRHLEVRVTSTAYHRCRRSICPKTTVSAK